MIPRSFSASALNVAQGCLSRYQRESLERGEDFVNDAAQLGTSVHGGLEAFIKQMMSTGDKPSLDDLLMWYRVSYMDTFNTSDTSTPGYEEGVEMLKKWYKREDYLIGKVLSAEVKTSYPVKTSVGEIPFNYIWDRFDQYDDNEYAVIDYKTNRWALSSDELRKKIQARMYGVMAQIQYPNAERIHVKFDMLRHDGMVGVVFSKDENIATWRWFKSEVERIIAAPDDPPETLNNECGWCIKQATCNALASNIAAGGVMSLTPVERMDLRAKAGYQMKGLKNLSDQLDALIEADAKAKDVFEMETENTKIKFAISSRRDVDAERVEEVVGEDTFKRYGGASITMGKFDQLLKDPNVTPEQVAKLKKLVYKNFGEPKVKAEPKSPFGD
jgi:hypothetical protein